MVLGLHLVGTASSQDKFLQPWALPFLVLAPLESPTSVLITTSLTLVAHRRLWAPAWFLAQCGLSTNPCGVTHRVLLCREGCAGASRWQDFRRTGIQLLEPEPRLGKPCPRAGSEDAHCHPSTESPGLGIWTAYLILTYVPTDPLNRCCPNCFHIRAPREEDICT